MTSDSSNRHFACAAAASITESHNPSRCVVATSIASSITACVVGTTA